MRPDLDLNYSRALANASARGVDNQVREFELRLNETVATINTSPNVLQAMAKGQNYLPYYRSLDLGARRIAEEKLHAHREAVDAKVHTGYGAHIVNAALSKDGKGLISYGPITLILQSLVLEDRAAVLRENAFKFYERYDLGRLNASEEPGWRSTWSERAKLGVAHLEPNISQATGAADYANIILSVGTSRMEDCYMEVHIYEGLTWQALERVCLERPLIDADKLAIWNFAKLKLLARNIEVVSV